MKITDAKIDKIDLKTLKTLKSFDKFGISEDTTKVLGMYENDDYIAIKTDKALMNEIAFPSESFVFIEKKAPFTMHTPSLGLDMNIGDMQFNKKVKEVVITDSLVDYAVIAQMYKYTQPIYYIPDLEALKTFASTCDKKRVSVINTKKTFLNDVGDFLKPEIICRVNVRKEMPIHKLYTENQHVIIKNLLEGVDMNDGINVLNTDSLFTEGLGFEANNFSFPFKGLNNLVGGIKKNEIMVIVAGSAGGKTDAAFRIMKSLVDQGETVGVFAMEQKYPQEVLFQMASYEGLFKYDVNQIVENGKDPQSPVMQNYLTRIKNFHEQVKIFDTTQVSLTIENIEVYIRNFVKVCGCKHIMIDHITFFAHKAGAKGTDQVGQFMTKLIELSQELACTFIVTTQVHKMGGKGQDAEDGAQISVGDIFGSSAVNHAASLIISLERNSLSQDDEVKNTTTLRVLKSRFDPQAMGKTTELWYDVDTAQKIDKDDRAEYEITKMENTVKVDEMPF